MLSLLHYGTQLSKDLLITLVGRPVRGRARTGGSTPSATWRKT